MHIAIQNTIAVDFTLYKIKLSLLLNRSIIIHISLETLDTLDCTKYAEGLLR